MPNKQGPTPYQHLDSLSYFERSLRDALNSITEEQDDQYVCVVVPSGSRAGDDRRDE